VALIAMVAVGAVGIDGSSEKTIFSNIANQLNGSSTSA
jgi:Flp pilus assembly pilin Flp